MAAAAAPRRSTRKASKSYAHGPVKECEAFLAQGEARACSKDASLVYSEVYTEIQPHGPLAVTSKRFCRVHAPGIVQNLIKNIERHRLVFVDSIEQPSPIETLEGLRVVAHNADKKNLIFADVVEVNDPDGYTLCMTDNEGNETCDDAPKMGKLFSDFILRQIDEGSHVVLAIEAMLHQVYDPNKTLGWVPNTTSEKTLRTHAQHTIASRKEAIQEHPIQLLTCQDQWDYRPGVRPAETIAVCQIEIRSLKDAKAPDEKIDLHGRHDFTGKHIAQDEANTVKAEEAMIETKKEVTQSRILKAVDKLVAAWREEDPSKTPKLGGRFASAEDVIGQMIRPNAKEGVAEYNKQLKTKCKWVGGLVKTHSNIDPYQVFHLATNDPEQWICFDVLELVERIDKGHFENQGYKVLTPAQREKLGVTNPNFTPEEIQVIRHHYNAFHVWETVRKEQVITANSTVLQSIWDAIHGWLAKHDEKEMNEGWLGFGWRHLKNAAKTVGKLVVDWTLPIVKWIWQHPTVATLIVLVLQFIRMASCVIFMGRNAGTALRDFIKSSGVLNQVGPTLKLVYDTIEGLFTCGTTAAKAGTFLVHWEFWSTLGSGWECIQSLATFIKDLFFWAPSFVANFAKFILNGTGIMRFFTASVIQVDQWRGIIPNIATLKQAIIDRNLNIDATVIVPLLTTLILQFLPDIIAFIPFLSGVDAWLSKYTQKILGVNLSLASLADFALMYPRRVLAFTQTLAFLIDALKMVWNCTVGLVIGNCCFPASDKAAVRLVSQSEALKSETEAKVQAIEAKQADIEQGKSWYQSHSEEYYLLDSEKYALRQATEDRQTEIAREFSYTYANQAVPPKPVPEYSALTKSSWDASFDV